MPILMRATSPAFLVTLRLCLSTVDAPYTVLDGSAALGTVTVDQRQAPAGFVDDGVWCQDVAVYQLASGTLLVRVGDQAGPSGSYVIADAVRVERVGVIAAKQ